MSASAADRLNAALSDRGVAVLLLMAVASACGPPYEVVIEGGRVMDPESGLDAIRNVGIVDGRVDAISVEPLEGARHVQAAGLVVAPGFVDLHRHGQNEEAYRLQVQDGVTTGLELEIGTPDVEAWYAQRVRRLRPHPFPPQQHRGLVPPGRRRHDPTRT